MITQYRLLDSGTLVTCTGNRHHLHSLEHRPDTEYACWPGSHRGQAAGRWASTLAEAEAIAGRARIACSCPSIP